MSWFAELIIFLNRTYSILLKVYSKLVTNVDWLSILFSFFSTLYAFLYRKWGNPKQPNEFNNGNNMNYNQSNYLNGNISSVTGFLHCNKSALNASNSNVNNSRRTRPMGQTNLTQPNFRFICNYNHSLGFPGMERSMNSSFINQGFNEVWNYIIKIINCPYKLNQTKSLL